MNKKQNMDWEETLNKAYKETYSGLINLMISKILETFGDKSSELLIEGILDLILNKIEPMISDDINIIDGFKNSDKEYLKIKRKIEIENKIKCARAQLRINILNDRNIRNDPYYSDIEPIDKDLEFVHDCIEQQEAAHIIAVSDLKTKVFKDEKYLDDISNCHNGILMDHIYHDAYDRGWFEFNLKGEMVPRTKWNEKYMDKNGKFIKYPLMKIKKDVFNENMKRYLIWKNSENI